MKKVNIVLLGDSILDNESYVDAGDSVYRQLSRRLSRDERVSGLRSRATLLASDGAVVRDVSDQVDSIPADATRLILSAGGNDALHDAVNLSDLAKMEVAFGDFALGYYKVVQKLAETGIPLTVCTIYDAVPGLSPEEIAGLGVYNRIIVKVATHFGASLIDLRGVCTDPEDYCEQSPIEPSAQGGKKIVDAILTMEAVCAS